MRGPTQGNSSLCLEGPFSGTVRPLDAALSLHISSNFSLPFLPPLFHCSSFPLSLPHTLFSGGGGKSCKGRPNVSSCLLVPPPFHRSCASVSLALAIPVCTVGMDFDQLKMISRPAQTAMIDQKHRCMCFVLSGQYLIELVLNSSALPRPLSPSFE